MTALFPQPRRLTPLDGPGVPTGTSPSVTLDPALPAQGYVLRVEAGTVALAHADDAGLRYGLDTLGQLAAAADGGAIAPVEVRDHPDFPVRGFMLDVSRDRVPTRGTLARVVALCATARINQLQLYTEHTFAYADHEEVWRDASPVTADDMRWLDDLCDAHGIELVANQNAFGHMERWLVHDTYRDRAEAPGGFELAGIPMPSAVLEPTPENAAFALGLIDELLATVRSTSVNIGADETFELGLGRSRERVETEGRGAVYVEHVGRLMAPLVERGYTVQYWADILGHHPEYLSELPAAAVPIVWLYDAPSTFDRARAMPSEMKEILEAFDMAPESMLKGFADRAGTLIEHGISFWVAPGTSTWLSLVGRIDNATENLIDAARTGLRHGSGGYLNTQWGDHGHLEPPVFGFVPMVLGGAYSWCVESNEHLDPAQVAADVVLDDATGIAGRAVDRLGRLWSSLGVPSLNGSVLHTALFPERASMVAVTEIDPERLRAALAEIDDVLATLDDAAATAPDGELAVREIRHGARLARLGARLLLDAATADPGAGTDAAVAGERLAELDALVADQRALWLERSRPGGLDDSVAKLEPLRALLATDAGHAAASAPNTAADR